MSVENVAAPLDFGRSHASLGENRFSKIKLTTVICWSMWDQFHPVIKVDAGHTRWLVHFKMPKCAGRTTNIIL